MRTKTTLFLFVLLLVVGTAAYYLLKVRVIPTGEGGNVLLSPQEAVQLDFLRFESRHTPQPIELQKRPDNTWHITAPVAWPANRFAVDRLLSQLQFLKKVSTFPAERLPDYGLDPPEGTLTYGYGAVRKVLRIGKVTDLERNVYLLPHDGKNIVVVRRSVLEDLQRPLEDWRSGDVFSIPPSEVRNWIVQSAEAGNTRVHFVREGESWRLESPIRARADRARVDTLLQKLLEDLEVETFWNEGMPDLNVLGLASPAFRVTITGSGSRRDSLLLGNPVDPAERPHVYYAKLEDNPTVFTVRVDMIEALRNAQIDLRDRRVVDVDPARLQSLTLMPAGQPAITLQKLETGRWQVQARTAERGLVTMDGDPDVIGALVQEIVGLRAVQNGGFVSEAPSATDLDRTYGLTGAAWQIQIVERAPGNQPGVLPPKKITLGRRTSAPDDPDGPENFQYASSEEGYIYLVDRGLGDDLRADAYHYRNRLLRQLAPGESITGLKLKRLGARSPDDELAFAVSLAGPDQSWDDALITQPPELRTAARQLLEQLRTLRAADIVAPDFPESVPGSTEMRSWTWELQVTIAQEGGDTQQTTTMNLFLDAYRGGTELLVGVPDLALTVTAEPAFIDAIRPFIFPQPDPGVPPAAEEPSRPAPDAPSPEAEPAETEQPPADGG